MQVFPSGRGSHPIGPGIEVKDDPVDKRRRGYELEEMTALE